MEKYGQKLRRRVKKIGAELGDLGHLRSSLSKLVIGAKCKKTLFAASSPPHYHVHAHAVDDDQPLFASASQSFTSSPDLRVPSTSSSSTASFVCGLCNLPKDLDDSFDFKGCTHFYCTVCIVEYVATELQVSVNWTVHCPVPGCTGLLEPDYCRPILPTEVFDSWMNGLLDQIEQSNFSNGEGSSSSSTVFTCDFCVEGKNLSDSFNVKGCSHFYCQQCIVNFVVSKLQDNVTSIGCPEPGCWGVLDPHYCRPVLPNEVFDSWGKALCETLILGSESNDNHFYCPFNDCSALMVIDEALYRKLMDNKKKTVLERSTCVHCKREVCLKCKTPWHTEFDCDKFQQLRDKGEDEMMKELAKQKRWRQCPKCKYYVEKKDGCSYIRCRCRYAFCYNCGVEASTTGTHICPHCQV